MIGRLSLENPILTREIRTRMRGARAFWILFTYVAILAIILFIFYFSWWNSVRDTFAGGGMSGASSVGKMFYFTLFTVQAILVGIITPSLTAGGISIEKEQRTFELLTVSLLPRRSIVLGKLISAVAFTALLLTASLPLVSLSFLVGGVAPSEVASAYSLLLFSAFLYGTVGLACSSVAKNTTSSTVMTYGAILLIFFTTLPLSLMGIPGALGAPSLTGGTGVGLTALNPIGAMTAATTTETYFGISVPAWLTAIVINTLFGSILTLVAIHRLDFPRTDRSAILRLMTAVLVGLLAFCVYGLFLPGNNTILSSSSFVVAAMLTVLAPIPLTPLFATAEGLPEKGGAWSIFDPRRLGKGEAPSGVVYLVWLMILCGVIMYAGALFVPGASTAKLEKAIPALTFLSIATVWGFGGLGVFFSALTQNRWSSFGLVAGLMIILYLIPSTAAAVQSSVGDSPVGWGINSVYITPLIGAAEIATGVIDATPDPTIKRYQTALIFGKTPIYLVTSVLYLSLGTICLFLASYVHARTRQRHEEALAKQEQEAAASG